MSAADSRMGRIASILAWILVLNLAVAVAKLVYGSLSGAIAIRADEAARVYDPMIQRVTVSFGDEIKHVAVETYRIAAEPP